jgi:octaheme c-type cytochrome (tetrathionate reductase family)
MPGTSLRWLWLWAAIAAILLVPVYWLAPDSKPVVDDPWTAVAGRRPPVDHAPLMDATYATPQAVTARCLECHEDAAEQVQHTVHWTWESPGIEVPGRDAPVAGGKRNLINNFCIGIRGNWESCTACHAGYGWEDDSFDFDARANIDCLVCHDGSGQYVKGRAGMPVDGVDLREVAMSVGTPSRDNCGSCHFSGGGGDAVKHGDLDSSLFHPTENVDVHMGRYDFICIDCHRTESHAIGGRALSVSLDTRDGIACTDCHAQTPHPDARLNTHTDAVACQTCHIPQTAVRRATKTHWDWSRAGDAQREDDHEYLKIKGEFVYERGIRPEYYWFNGRADRYLLGDPINPDGVTPVNYPLGSINDPEAKIWPFKVHLAKQVYDRVHNHLLQPETAGPEGYWKHFDWDRALRSGARHSGIEYSGEYGFTETSMYWPQTHMVAAKENALQCVDCHAPGGRLDWQALGYPGDPLRWGGRDRLPSQLADSAGAP